MRTPKLLSGLFGPGDLRQLQKATTQAEKNTSGEIRIRVVETCEAKHHGNPRRQAIADFYRLGMQRTRDKTGVLIWLAVKDRRFEIVADKGINAKISESEWLRLSDSMTRYFKRGMFKAGLLKAVLLVGRKLASHFPILSDDVNEVINEVSVGSR